MAISEQQHTEHEERLRALWEEVGYACGAVLPDVAEAVADSPADLAVLWQAIQGARQALALAADEVERLLVEQVGSKGITVPGVGLVEAKRSVSRKGWRNDDLIQHLASRLADEPTLWADEETGERHPPSQVVANVVRAFSRYGNPSWRVTALREAGIQVDEFCSEEWGVKRLRVTPS